MHHTWSARVLAVAVRSVNGYHFRALSPVQSGDILTFSHYNGCTSARFCPGPGTHRRYASIAPPGF